MLLYIVWLSVNFLQILPCFDAVATTHVYLYTGYNISNFTFILIIQVQMYGLKMWS